MSALAWDRPLGRLARVPLRLIPRDIAIPVLRPELRETLDRGRRHARLLARHL